MVILVLSSLIARPCHAAARVDKQPGATTGTSTSSQHNRAHEATGDHNWKVVTTVEGRTLIAKDPANPVNYIRASLAAYHQGKLDHAVELLEEGRRVAEPSALLHLALGALYLEQGRLVDADNTTRDALRLEPDNLEAQVQLGRILARTGLHHEAAVCFKQVLAEDKEHQEAQSRLIVSLLANGAARDAEYHCRLFLTRGKERTALWVGLGEALELQGKMREAFNCYGQALAINADLATAHSHRGRLFCRFGQFEAAAAECRTALRLDPDDAMAHAYLSIACSRLGLKDEARDHAQLAEKGGMQMKSILSGLNP